MSEHARVAPYNCTTILVIGVAIDLAAQLDAQATACHAGLSKRFLGSGSFGSQESSDSGMWIDGDE